MCKCLFNVQMCKCANVRMCKCENVQMLSECENVQMFYRYYFNIQNCTLLD